MRHTAKSVCLILYFYAFLILKECAKLVKIAVKSHRVGKTVSCPFDYYESLSYCRARLIILLAHFEGDKIIGIAVDKNGRHL